MPCADASRLLRRRDALRRRLCATRSPRFAIHAGPGRARARRCGGRGQDRGRGQTRGGSGRGRPWVGCGCGRRTGARRAPAEPLGPCKSPAPKRRACRGQLGAARAPGGAGGGQCTLAPGGALPPLPLPLDSPLILIPFLLLPLAPSLPPTTSLAPHLPLPCPYLFFSPPFLDTAGDIPEVFAGRATGRAA